MNRHTPTLCIFNLIQIYIYLIQRSEVGKSKPNRGRTQTAASQLEEADLSKLVPPDCNLPAEFGLWGSLKKHILVQEGFS